MQTFEDACHGLAAEIATMLIAKQADYGKSNILEFGEMGILVRANDKMARLKHLLSGHEFPKVESIEDSWRDLAGYSILALMLQNGSLT